VGSLASTDLDVEGQGHIEVACMAHVNHGVRRLVKSVIRGLKVCYHLAHLGLRIMHIMCCANVSCS